MSDAMNKSFDCVRMMREARDRISAEIEGKSHDEIIECLRSHRYKDPILRRMANRAAREAQKSPR